MTERRRIHFAGRVQGVGFRYTALSVARHHPIRGYVQNLPDGRVVLVAEGEGEALDAYLAELAGIMRGQIRGTTAEAGLATGEFSGFEIRH